MKTLLSMIAVMLSTAAIGMTAAEIEQEIDDRSMVLETIARCEAFYMVKYQQNADAVIDQITTLATIKSTYIDGTAEFFSQVTGALTTAEELTDQLFTFYVGTLALVKQKLADENFHIDEPVEKCNAFLIDLPQIIQGAN